MSRHHPTDDLLVEYAAGSTSASLALCLSVHLKYCPRCQATVNRLTLLGSVLFESQPGAAVPDEMFDRIMARIDSVDALAASRVRDTPVKQARRLLHSWLPSGGWQTVMWKQQWFKVYEFLLELSADGRQRLALQKINAGGRAPTHGHHGREITVVLEGGFSDEEGIYEEGDFIIRDGQHEHRPRAMENSDCVCLTLLEAPVRLTGPFGQCIEFLRHFFTPALYRT